ncbi:MAG TPA: DUF5667 domain-containing protein [Nocardioidaceae bacterium]|nr:DUF5667 domain-containing protein [Nocardioidaceae bacterium]
MTSLLPARRRAEEFAALIDGGARSHVASSPEVVDLAGLVTLLRDRAERERATPREDFARDLRARLLAEAETALSPENARLALPARQRGTRERRLVAAATAAVLLGGSTTMAAAAQGALPGEALYPIKRGIEHAEAGLSLSPAGKGKDLLHQAEGRLVEVDRLLTDTDGQDLARAEETLAAFGHQATEGADLLFSSYEETRDPVAIEDVRAFTADGMRSLEQLSRSAPAAAQDDLADAAMLLRDLDRAAESLCSGCAADLPTLDLPATLMARAEAERALGAAADLPLPLANDHPVVVPKDVLDRLDLLGGGTKGDRGKDGTTGGAGGGGSTDEDGSGTNTEAPAVPSPEDWPETLPSLLPQPGDTKTSGGGTSSEGSVLDDLTDGLDGAVETLLPKGGSDDDSLLP